MYERRNWSLLLPLKVYSPTLLRSINSLYLTYIMFTLTEGTIWDISLRHILNMQAHIYLARKKSCF
nr:hypothetical protein [uncultured bacterium]